MVLKSYGFRWSPNAGAWQRQLTDNAIYAAKRIPFLWPLPKQYGPDDVPWDITA